MDIEKLISNSMSDDEVKEVVRKAVESSIKDAVQKFFVHGPGEKMIAVAIAEAASEDTKDPL